MTDSKKASKKKTVTKESAQGAKIIAKIDRQNLDLSAIPSKKENSGKGNGANKIYKSIIKSGNSYRNILFFTEKEISEMNFVEKEKAIKASRNKMRKNIMPSLFVDVAPVVKDRSLISENEIKICLFFIENVYKQMCIFNDFSVSSIASSSNRQDEYRELMNLLKFVNENY